MLVFTTKQNKLLYVNIFIMQYSNLFSKSLLHMNELTYLFHKSSYIVLGEMYLNIRLIFNRKYGFLFFNEDKVLNYYITYFCAQTGLKKDV